MKEGNLMNEYYKKIDKSFFNYGITIPKDYEEIFLINTPLEPGSSRNIDLIFQNTKYNCKLSHVNRSSASNVYQLRWDSNYALLTVLKKEFIQTYFAIISQNFIAKENKKYYITKLLGGNQEVVIFKPKNISEIELEAFIKIETPYDNIFKSLVDQNVFGWLSKDDIHEIVTKSTKWIDISQLYLHEDISYVIYYLVDEIHKEIYIGSAKRLGDRVKAGRVEIPGWNKFRYEIIHPAYHANLKEVEYHSIMNFARFFTNNGSLSSLNVCEYRLVNKDYKYYQR